MLLGGQIRQPEQASSTSSPDVATVRSSAQSSSAMLGGVLTGRWNFLEASQIAYDNSLSNASIGFLGQTHFTAHFCLMTLTSLLSDVFPLAKH